MAKLTVSIINYKTAELTRAALQSVKDDIEDLDDVSVVVVDNASKDGSAEAIETWIEQIKDPRFKMIKAETNSGFSGGHNQGMASDPTADFYLILNSDALIRPGFFEAILREAEAHPEFGLIAPQLEDADETPQKSCFRFHSIASEFIRGAATGPLTKLLKRHVVALPERPDQKEIEWASFACILLKGQMVKEIGPMDEGYFLYFEDAEYALRARRAGWRVHYTPLARAVHFRGGSGPVKDRIAQKKRLPEYYWRSRSRFLRQAYGPMGPFLGNLAWMVGRAVSQSRWVFGKPPFSPIEGEWRDMWLGFLNPLRPDMEPRG